MEPARRASKGSGAVPWLLATFLSVLLTAEQGGDGVARAQPAAPGSPASLIPTLPGDLAPDGEETDDIPTIGAPAADAAPRRVDLDEKIPEIPTRPPDGFAVMPFENRSGVRSMDWMSIGVPLALAEKVERVSGLAPAYGPLVVAPGPVVRADAAVVARFAASVGARWVFTGWVERPEWELRLAISLWRIDNGAATSLGEIIARAGFGEVHRLIGDAVLQLNDKAHWRLTPTADAVLHEITSADFYAFTLLGRGLAHLLGTYGPVDLVSARRDLEKAIFIDPKLAVGQRLHGEVLLLDKVDPKATSKAAGKLAYALDLRPDYVPALRAVAARSASTGKHDVARDLYERLVRLRPWDLEARRRLGEAMWQTGDGDGALRELTRVIKRVPDDLAARRILAVIHAARGDTADLVAELEQVARLAPRDVDVKLDLGAAYVATGRLRDAAKTYEGVFGERPEDPTPPKLIADIYRRLGERDAAARWYVKASAAAPDDPRPYFLLGSLYLEAGYDEEAGKAFTRAEKFKRWLGQTYIVRGAMAYRAGDHTTARWYLKRAVQRLPRDVTARYDYALTLSAAGLVDEALVQVDVALKMAPGDADLHYLRGVILLRQGSLVPARREFGAAMAADPGHVDARFNATTLDSRGVRPDQQ